MTIDDYRRGVRSWLGAPTRPRQHFRSPIDVVAPSKVTRLQPRTDCQVIDLGEYRLARRRSAESTFPSGGAA